VDVTVLIPNTCAYDVTWIQ